jgi:hypothetical protein
MQLLFSQTRASKWASGAFIFLSNQSLKMGKWCFHFSLKPEPQNGQVVLSFFSQTTASK